MRKSAKGITLIELMVTVAILAIITAVAYPSFMDGLRKSRRAEGLKGLLTMQLKLEEYRISHGDYNATLADVGNPSSNYYTFERPSGASPTTYSLKATTKGAQVGDKAGNTSCDTLTLTKGDDKGVAAPCWQ